MIAGRYIAIAVLTLAAVHPAAGLADDLTGPGRKIYEDRCKGCHEAGPRSAESLGPSLDGIVGRPAGSGDTGVHSRAAVESGTVWSRSSLRRYLSGPERDMPGTFMTERVTDARDLDALLNYLESLR